MSSLTVIGIVIIILSVLAIALVFYQTIAGDKTESVVAEKKPKDGWFADLKEYFNIMKYFAPAFALLLLLLILNSLATHK
jgi:hypothetical protein